MRNLRVMVLATASLAAIAAGCGSDPLPPPAVGGDTTTPSVKRTATVEPKKVDTDKPSSGSIHIDDKIMKACGDVPAAHFAFDSTTIEGDAATTLDALAKCFVTGPLKGKGMKLIGHADQRGETEYNLALGQKRAGSVGEYLGKKGLEQGRVTSSSKGEFEATGTDEAGWARDRKVEVLLAE